MKIFVQVHSVRYKFQIKNCKEKIELRFLNLLLMNTIPVGIIRM